MTPCTVPGCGRPVHHWPTRCDPCTLALADLVETLGDPADRSKLNTPNGGDRSKLNGDSPSVSGRSGRY